MKNNELLKELKELKGKEIKAIELDRTTINYLGDGCKSLLEYSLKELEENGGYSPNNNINIEFEIIEKDEFDECNTIIKIIDVYKI